MIIQNSQILQMSLNRILVDIMGIKLGTNFFLMNDFKNKFHIGFYSL